VTEPDVYFADDGTPRSARFGDIYYSPQDGLAESRAVFLEGCHLARAWTVESNFTILELGFGTGLNIAAVLELWTRSGCPGQLHVFTVEAFVMARDQAATALANWPELAQFAQAITAQWPDKRRGFHHMDFPQWRVSVTVALMEVEAALEAWEGRADAVFLDGFSPSLNPDMWSPAVFGRIAARVRPGARLATFTVAGHVRRGLQAAGFTVAKCPGFGRKRERLEASFEGEPVSSPRPRRIAVAGAAIAGACVAWQARLLGAVVRPRSRHL
jgi:tRNA 5-methylaminomethyl-2-thiouridine biosynthesis bifunctional protein